MTSIWHVIALAGCVACTTGAQLLLKAGALRSASLASSFVNRFTILGYLLFGLNTLLVAYALQGIDLKTGSTWSAVPYVLVTALASRLYGEPFSRTKILGSGLIVLGVLVFTIA